MRFLFSMSSFAFTMVLSLLAFALTAFYYPTTLRAFLANATYLHDQFSLLGLPDSVMVWVDLLMESKQIVLVGYSIMIRLCILLLDYIIFGRPRVVYVTSNETVVPPRNNNDGSPFSRW